MAQTKPSFYPRRRHLLIVAVVALAIYVLLPQFGDFRSSWKLLSSPNPSYTGLAILLAFATYVAGTGTYMLLSFTKLRFGRTWLVQLAAMFVNRLLPAGVGALGVNYLYLRRERHKAVQAVTVVGINNLWGGVGHGLLVTATLVLFPTGAMVSAERHGVNQGLILGALGLAAALMLVAAIVFGRRKLIQVLKDIKNQILSYRRRPLSLFGALGTSMTLTLCNVLCLYSCMYALGISLPFAAVLLVFSFGVGTGAAVPTPGGLGGFEAGLAAGFVAYGIDASPALAVALLFRLVSYWLPLIAGVVAFMICQKQNLFNAASS